MRGSRSVLLAQHAGSRGNADVQASGVLDEGMASGLDRDLDGRRTSSSASRRWSRTPPSSWAFPVASAWRLRAFAAFRASTDVVIVY